MKKQIKKIAAALLSTSLLFTSVNIPALAEEGNTVSEEAAMEAETKATETETQAPETEAPAPETQAPETEVQVPETEKLAPETEAPALETEAPVTEKKVEAAQTSEKKEKEKETETEKLVFTAEKDGYTVTVEFPKDADTSELGKLTVKEVDDTEEWAEQLLTQVNRKLDTETLEEMKILDIHFESDGEEDEVEKREESDISVKVEFNSPAFADSFSDGDLKVYHISDTVKSSLSGKLSEEDFDTDTLVECKAEAESSGSGVSSVTFKTDGFSNFAIGVAAEKEEEAETQAVQTEAETEREEQLTEEVEWITETLQIPEETEPEQKEQTGEDTEAEEMDTEVLAEELEIETEPVIADDAANDVSDSKMKFMISSTEESEACSLVIKVKDEDVKLDAGQITAVVGTKDPVTLTGSSLNISSDKKTLTIPLTIGTKEVMVTVTGLPEKTSAETEPTYEINAGGNYIDAETGMLKGKAEFYSSYLKTEEDAEKAAPQEVLTPFVTAYSGNLNLTIKNIHTSTAVSAEDKESGETVGCSFRIYKDDIDIFGKDIPKNGIVKGLPAGKYTYELVEDTVPLTYMIPSKETASFTIPASNETVTKKFSLTAIKLAIYPVDSETKSAITDPLEYSVTDVTTGEKRTVVCKDGEALVPGVIERGHKYKVIQSTRAKYHIQVGTSQTITITGKKERHSLTFSNVPTKVSVTVLDGSKTSSNYDKPVAGATIQIQGGGTTLNVTSENGTKTITGQLEPGTYTITQTGAATGYIVNKAVSTMNLSTTKGSASYTIKNDTVKLAVSRKGYDSRTKSADGKSYQYKNRVALSGAQLVLKDASGNVVDKWTSTKEEHLIEGKLAAGTEYTLEEVTAPKGYDKWGSGKITTNTTGAKKLCTAETRVASGKITVTLREKNGSSYIKKKGTYYCMLYLDAGKTQKYQSSPVALLMTGDNVDAKAVFNNLPSGTYWVGECDSSGKLISGNGNYSISYPLNEKLNLNPGASLVAEINHTYQNLSSGSYTNASSSELENSYNSQYGEGGSYESAAAAAAGSGTTPTGDSTNIILYVVLLIVALAALVGVVIIRKKRRK
ncbi:MAG: SpaA isopeptide-forming pilin-related protein [Muricoprocola sp.]